jgi:hypothetical protein
MIPAAFEYARAHTVQEAISLLQQYGGRAKLLAGGHSLLRPWWTWGSWTSCGASGTRARASSSVP